MDAYQAIAKEIYVYGNKNIPNACSKQKPVTIGKCVVRTICDGIVVDELANTYAWAKDFITNRLLANYPRARFNVRMNKCKAGVLYYATIINAMTRHEEFSVQILN